MYFNGRLRKAARLLYHSHYGAYIPAQWKSDKKLHEMNLTPDEWVKVEKIVEWMCHEVLTKDRLF